MLIEREHLYFHTPLAMPVPEKCEVAYLALGCFWGAERKLWQLRGVVSTAVGYQGGFTPNPTYQEVCTGNTGHAEALRVIFDPEVVTYDGVLQRFFENHDPTQGFGQGADIGTQYRSAIFYVGDTQGEIARHVIEVYGEALHQVGYGLITTEVTRAGPFYMAEEYHQQYLIANPGGYCGLGGTGVTCAVGLDLG